MEKFKDNLEHLKTINPNKIGAQVLKSADVMLVEYLENGGSDEEYIEYLKGNRLDPRM